MYGFLLAKNADASFLIVIVKGNESVTDIAKRKEYFENIFKKKVAFYFDEISYRAKQRLIKRKDKLYSC